MDNVFSQADKFVSKMLKVSRYNLSDVFVDLLDLYICVHSMGRMEKEYHEIISKYNPKELEIITELMSDILFSYSNYVIEKQDYDLLGSVYEAITSKYKSSALGQFFTPIHLTRLMAFCVGIHEIQDEYIFVNEPTVGSGRCCISAFNLNQNIIFSTTDKDKICVKMCIVNMHLYQMLGSEVLHGDSLTLEFWGGYRIGLDYPKVENMFGKIWNTLPEEKRNELLEINKKLTMVIIPFDKEDINYNTSIYYTNIRNKGLSINKSKARLKKVFDFLLENDNKNMEKEVILNSTKVEVINENIEIQKEVLEVRENKSITFEFKKKKGFDNQVSLFDI